MALQVSIGRSIVGLIFPPEVGGGAANRLLRLHKATLLGTNYSAFLYALSQCVPLAHLCLGWLQECCSCPSKQGLMQTVSAQRPFTMFSPRLVPIHQHWAQPSVHSPGVFSSRPLAWQQGRNCRNSCSPAVSSTNSLSATQNPPCALRATPWLKALGRVLAVIAVCHNMGLLQQSLYCNRQKCLFPYETHRCWKIYVGNANSTIADYKPQLISILKK